MSDDPKELEQRLKRDEFTDKFNTDAAFIANQADNDVANLDKLENVTVDDLTVDDLAVDNLTVEDLAVEEPTKEEAEIIDEMDAVREKLGGGIDRLGDEMRNVFDWQSYVRSAPLTSVGIALAAGFLIAPAIRSRALPEMALPPGSVPVAPPRSSGIFGSITSIAFSTLSKMASSYLFDVILSNSQSGSSAMPGSGDSPVRPPDAVD